MAAELFHLIFKLDNFGICLNLYNKVVFVQLGRLNIVFGSNRLETAYYMAKKRKQLSFLKLCI